MKLSYLITCKNETKTLSNLLENLISVRLNEDEIVIIDDYSDNEKTKEILKSVSKVNNVFLYQNHLNNDYGSQKNIGIQKCSGSWVFQIDGDELPSDSLVFNIREIIETNKNIELIWVPRINAWEGLTEEHAKQWGWKLDISPTYKRFRAAWPDYQGRIFKKDYPRIHWERKLHEHITGQNEHAFLPDDEELSLYHDKTIETQVETNLRYNKQFSTEENKGISQKYE